MVARPMGRWIWKIGLCETKTVTIIELVTEKGDYKTDILATQLAKQDCVGSRTSENAKSQNAKPQKVKYWPTWIKVNKKGVLSQTDTL